MDIGLRCSCITICQRVTTPSGRRPPSAMPNGGYLPLRSVAPRAVAVLSSKDRSTPAESRRTKPPANGIWRARRFELVVACLSRHSRLSHTYTYTYTPLSCLSRTSLRSLMSLAPILEGWCTLIPHERQMIIRIAMQPLLSSPVWLLAKHKTSGGHSEAAFP